MIIISKWDDLTFWIHCVAGVNRTGSLIAAVAIADKIINREFDADQLDHEIEQIVLHVRSQRGGDALSCRRQIAMLSGMRNYYSR